MFRQHKIGAVIPAFNVEDHLKHTIEELPDFIDKIYVVDDGSTDNTACLIQNISSRLCLIRHGTNKGPGAAMTTGYRAAMRDKMDILVKLDGDGQMRSESIQNLVTPIIEKKADYTKGDRISSSEFRRTMPRFRLLGNFVLTYLTRVASGYWHINDTQNGFVAISRQALENIDIDTLYPYYGYLNDILTRLNVAGFKVQDVTMPAKYGSEKSSIRLVIYVPKVSLFLLSCFLWRLRAKYLRFNGKLHLSMERTPQLPEKSVEE